MQSEYVNLEKILVHFYVARQYYVVITFERISQQFFVQRDAMAL